MFRYAGHRICILFCTACLLGVYISVWRNVLSSTLLASLYRCLYGIPDVMGKV